MDSERLKTFWNGKGITWPPLESILELEDQNIYL